MVLRQVLKSKLHHARITYANPEYVGSIEVGRDLMDAVGLVDGELVHVWAVDHKSRLETYVFGGPNGTVGMNGGAAHFFEPGDRVIIASFATTDETVTPQVVLLGDNNEILRDMSPFSIHG